MKKHIATAVVCLVLSVLVMRPGGVSSGASATPGFNLGDLKKELTQYRESGQYDRDVEAVFADAQSYVEQHAKDFPNPAIVLDIDETSLSNWPEMKANDFGTILTGPCDTLPVGPCGIRSWEMKGQGTAIQPAVKLVKSAQAHGVSLFFISGRPENERSATAENLHKAGYDNWVGLSLKPVDMKITTAAEFKAPERAKIAAQGYRIIANIGDQPSDLAGGYADKTFLVPNPFYRVP